MGRREVIKVWLWESSLPCCMSWPPWEAVRGGGGGGGWRKGKPEAGWGWDDATVCGPVTGATALSGGGGGWNLGALILPLPLTWGTGRTWGWTTGFGRCSCGSNWAEESAKINILKMLWYCVYL